MLSDLCISTLLGIFFIAVGVVALGLLIRSRRRQGEERKPWTRENWLALIGTVLIPLIGGVYGVVRCSDQLPDVRISLADSRLHPAESQDPADEYVCLVNEEGDGVSITGWELRNAERRINAIPQFSLGPGGAVRVHPGRGTDSAIDLFGEEGSSAWRNEGGQITLLDDKGEVIDQQGYGSRSDGDGSGACGAIRKPGKTGSRPTCDPNYEGACLDPNALDYDCAGGDGDGPRYVEGPVRVVGEDHFDLGRNGDKVACEP